MDLDYIVKKIKKKNILWNAIILSLLIHLIFGTLFRINISIQHEKKNKLSKVSFLGSILPPFSTTNLTKIYTFKTPKETYTHTKVIGYREKKQTSPLEMQKGEKKLKAEKEVVYLDKPKMVKLKSESVFFLPFQRGKEEYIGIENTKSKIDRSSNREIMYSPKLKNLKDLLLLYPSAGSVVLKISVLPIGRVRRIRVIRSSGEPAVDITFKDYLRKWIFTPINFNKVQKGKVIFDLSSEELNIEVKDI